MSRTELLSRLAQVAQSRGFPDDPATLDRLLDYLVAVLAWRGRVNLTGARDLEDAVRILALSALAVTRAWDDPEPPRRVVDLGTGNGLPGVAAALAWPASRVLLVERRGRKADAVAACLHEVGLERTEVLKADAREVPAHRPDLVGCVDLVTVRAVGSLEEALRYTVGWLAPGGRLAHWKGSRLSAAETEAGERAADRLGLRPLPTMTFADDAGPARLVLYERPRVP